MNINCFSTIKRAWSLFFIIPILIFIASCKSEESKGCHLSKPIEKAILISIPDSIVKLKLVDMKFSPIDRYKIWIKTSSYSNPVYSIDINSGEISLLNIKLIQAYDYSEDVVFDPFDSVYWIPGAKLTRYNSRKAEIQEYNFFSWFKVFVTPQKIFFVSSDTLKYMEKSNSRIYIVNQLSGIKIVNIDALSDSVFIINKELAYNFFLQKIIFRIDARPYFRYKNEFNMVACKDGIELYSKDERLYWASEREIHELPAEFRNNDLMKFDAEGIWQTHFKYIYHFDFLTHKFTKYFFRFPFSFMNYKKIEVNNGFIWFNPQPYAISLKDSLLYTYRVSAEDSPIKLLSDECNIYQLYDSFIKISPINRTMSSFIQFDAKGYDSITQEFNSFIYKCYTLHDSTLAMAYNTVNLVKNLYGTSTNEEIQDGIRSFQEVHFCNLAPKTRSEYEYLLNNDSMPVKCKTGYFNDLLRITAKKGEFGSLIGYYEKYSKIFIDSTFRKYTDNEINVIKHYLKYSDSLNNSKLSKDSMEYLRAACLKNVCQTTWFEGEVGYNYSLYKSALLRFMKEFPKSDLKDNADFEYWSTSFCSYYEEGNPDGEYAEIIIKQYNKLLIKYPNSEIRDDIEFEIFNLKFGSSLYSDKYIRNLANKYLLTYPNSNHISDIRNYMSNINFREDY